MKKILIIDDEIFATENLAHIIEKLGCKVFATASGEEGVRLYSEHKPDLVLLDVLLPGIDGEDVFRYIKDIDAKANICFITGNSSIFSQDHAQKLGACNFLEKPLTVDTIVKLLQSMNG